MSNKERQANYRARLLERASGVTPGMVVQAARVLHDASAAVDPSLGSWEDRLARCRQKKNRRDWREMIPDDTTPDAFDFLEGEDRVLVERVAVVMAAATYPPAA